MLLTFWELLGSLGPGLSREAEDSVRTLSSELCKDSYYRPDTKTCVSKCPYSYRFIVSGDNTCRSSCPGGKPYHNSGGTLCRGSCSGTYKYYVNNTYECLTNCPQRAPYVQVGKYTCFTDCPSEYPLKLSSYSSIPYNCYYICPDGWQYRRRDRDVCYRSCPYPYSYHKRDDYYCELKCTGSDPGDYFFLNGYSCYVECPSGYYHAVDRYICWSGCQSDRLFNVDQDFVCYASCPI